MKTSLKILSDEASFDPSPRFAKNEKEAIKFLNEGKEVTNLIDFRDSKKVMLLAVKRNGMNLLISSIRLKKDKDVVLAAVSNNGLVLEYAAEPLKSNYEVVISAIISNGEAIKFADKRIINKNLVLLALGSYTGSSILCYADQDSKKDIEVAISAIRVNWKEIYYVDDTLFTDPRFISVARLVLLKVYSTVSELEQDDIMDFLLKLPEVNNINTGNQYTKKQVAI